MDVDRPVGVCKATRVQPDLHQSKHGEDGADSLTQALQIEC